MLRPQARIAALGLVSVLATGTAQAQAIPDLASGATGWRLLNSPSTDFIAPATGPKPVTNDPKFPHVGNNEPGQKTDRVSDVTNPILQPWAAEEIAKTNDRVVKDGRSPFVATSLCYPGGVPAQLLVPTNVYFLQKPHEVVMIWERDQLVRRVFLNREHSKDVKPSWYGESVGHYENGDTLVIDTIGLSDNPLSFVDNFRTPHTTKLHVVEHWKIVDRPKGKGIDASIWVEDPGAFTTPWTGMVKYDHTDARETEVRCAENNPDYFGLDDYHSPTATKLDF